MNDGQVGGVVDSGCMANDKWLAVDLDGTLAVYDGWKGEEHIGEPVVSIVEAINARRAAGWKVAIFTARVSGDQEEAHRAEIAIWKWLDFYNIKAEGITCTKHKHFSEFWDDRARQVVFNKGHIVEAVTIDTGPGTMQIKRDVLQEELDAVNLEVGCSLDVQVGGSHYKDMVIQPAEYCEYNNIPALEAAVIKYVSRHQNKNGVQDLEKAKDLINMIIDMRYGTIGIASLEARLAKLQQGKTDGVKND